MKRIENELKMKRTKNRLAVMLAMILCVKLLPVTAYAATFTANDWATLQTAVASPDSGAISVNQARSCCKPARAETQGTGAGRDAMHCVSTLNTGKLNIEL